jgi:hypothetical protein
VLVELSNILEWVKRRKLPINMSKSKEIVLCKSRSRCLVSPPALIRNIEQIKEVKLVGVWFNSRLSFSAHAHVDNVLSTVNQRFLSVKSFKKPKSRLFWP